MRFGTGILWYSENRAQRTERNKQANCFMQEAHFKDFKLNSSGLNDMIYVLRLEKYCLNATETLRKKRNGSKMKCEINKYQHCKFICIDYT